MSKSYALYKGDNLLHMGEIFQIAQKMNVRPETIEFYGTPSYLKRINERESKNALMLICLDGESDE